MKTYSLTRVIAFCVSAFLSPIALAEPPAPPKPPAKPQPKPQPKPKPAAKPAAQPGGLSEAMKKYDTDHNKILNVTESRMIQDAYKANPQDPLLKKYDANKDAQLSDAEIMKIMPPPPAPPKPKAKPKAKPKKAPEKKK